MKSKFIYKFKQWHNEEIFKKETFSSQYQKDSTVK